MARVGPSGFLTEAQEAPVLSQYVQGKHLLYVLTVDVIPTEHELNRQALLPDHTLAELRANALNLVAELSPQLHLGIELHIVIDYMLAAVILSIMLDDVPSVRRYIVHDAVVNEETLKR
jgi:hypothetical protein